MGGPHSDDKGYQAHPWTHKKYLNTYAWTEICTPKQL